MPFELQVAVRREGQPHFEITFDRSPITLGALAHNDVVLSDAYVSGEHATVLVSRGELVFRDSSRNGSYVDGERIGSVRLGQGGKVSIPPFEVELRLAPSGESRQTRYRGGVPPVPVPHEAGTDDPSPVELGTERDTVDHFGDAEEIAQAAKAAEGNGDGAGPEEDSTVLSDGPPAVPPRVRLHVLHGADVDDGEVFELPALPAVRIGRSQTADLTLPVMTVSRLHTVIRWGDDGSILLVDLGSSNGTYVNGRRLTGDDKACLADGDQLRLGELVTEVELVPWEGLPEKPEGDIVEPGD